MADPASNTDREGWGSAILFWLLLVAAGLLLAAVSLAPRARTLADLRNEYRTNQLQLVELERKAIELEKIAEALSEDPTFATQLARIEFSAGRPGEERIAVPESLRLGSESPGREDAGLIGASLGWDVPPAVLEPLATSAALRATLLALSGALVLAAFLLCGAGRSEAVRAVAGRASQVSSGIARRYRKAA